MIASIIVDVNNSNVNKTFDYIIKEEFKDIIKIGSRVIVNFKNRFVLGFVLDIHNNTLYATKYIDELIDIYPVLSLEMIEIVKKFSNRGNNLIISFIKTILPNVLNIKVKKTFKVINYDKLNKELLPLVKDDYILLDQKYLKIIKDEIDNLNIAEKYSYNLEKIKKEKYIKLNDIFDEKKIKNIQQKQIIEYLKINGDTLKQKLDTISSSSLKTLEKNGIIKIYESDGYRKIENLYKEEEKSIILTNEQLNVLNKINLNSNEKYLLYGVTNSGKTEVYLNLISEVLKNNKQAIMLVPEISLTPQIISRFKNRFPDLISVFHSGLSDYERFDEYRKILDGKSKIVIGTRSAIFMPFKNLGLIIFDEEHDESYIQTDYPSYDAREIAEFRSRYHNCPVLYASATPKVTSYYNALNNNYKLLKMQNKINSMPIIKQTIDMTDEFKNNNLSIFSKYLQEKIIDRLNKHEQILLLLNKKGHNQFVMCRECGHVLKCDHCDVSYTYYKSDDTLRCLYCGKKIKNINICPKCNSKYIRYVGVGTEKVEEELKKLFSNIKVLRLDKDTVMKKNSYEKYLSDFNNKKYDCLVGTQMISKGHDFSNVTLVAIINADLSLAYPDYLAKEKTFDLISQMVGRCGRNKQGEVIIQTYNKNNNIIKYATNQDYIKFYNDEIIYRKIGNYPPFYNFYEIIFKGINQKDVLNYALKIKNDFLNEFKNEIVIGPSSNFIEKIKDNYLFTMKIKTNKNIDDFLNKILNKPNIIVDIIKK